MASLSRLVNNDVPFVANVPVFATATGLLLKGGIVSFITANTATGTYFGLTTAADTTQLRFALGPLNMSGAQAIASKENLAQSAARYNFGTSGIPNRGVTGQYNWMQVVANHDQLDYITWNQTSAGCVSANITASTGTLIVQTGLEASIGGAWIFSTDTHATITNTFTGSLRYVNTISATTGSVGLATAMNVSTDSNLVVMRPMGHRFTTLDTTGRFLNGTSTAGVGVSAHIWENYIMHAQSPLTPLRFWNHDGLDGLSVYSVQLMAEIIYLHHTFRNSA